MDATRKQRAFIRALAEGLGMDEETARRDASQQLGESGILNASALINELLAVYRRRGISQPKVQKLYRWHLHQLSAECGAATIKAERAAEAMQDTPRCVCGGQLEPIIASRGPFDKCVNCGLVALGAAELSNDLVGGRRGANG